MRVHGYCRYSPLAPSKLKKITDNVNEAKQLLAAGK